MDGLTNHFARCEQYFLTKLQYQIFGIKRENASPRDSLGLLTMSYKKIERRGFDTQALGGFP